MNRLLVFAMLAACASDDEAPDPATCPAEPFEHCGVYDNGWDVWCEAGVVRANDMTANAFCYPASGEVACMTGVHRRDRLATTSCATLERRYFDYYGDYQAFDPATLCAP